MTFKGIRVNVIGATEWADLYSEAAHLVAFGTEKPGSWDRLDYALLLVEEKTDAVTGYVTCREFDHETVYWQFGGAMPGTKGSTKSLVCFDAMLEFAKLIYKRVTFNVENDNEAMIKLALHRGFRIVGVRNFKGHILLEHLKEL